MKLSGLWLVYPGNDPSRSDEHAEKMAEKSVGSPFHETRLPKVQQQRPQRSQRVQPAARTFFRSRTRFRSRPFLLRQLALQAQTFQPQFLQQLAWLAASHALLNDFRPGARIVRFAHFIDDCQRESESLFHRPTPAVFPSIRVRGVGSACYLEKESPCFLFT